MQENNQKKESGKKPKVSIYTIILLAYLMTITILFVYSLKFLKTNINLLFAPIDEQNIEKKLISLDLENYNLLEKKLALENNEIDFNMASSSEASSSDMVLLTDVILPTDETQENNETSVISEVQALNDVIQNEIENLNISIVNSTKTSGLAAALKKKLENQGYTVSNIASQQKTELQSLIMLKKNIDSLSEAEIKLIELVGQEYNLEKRALPSDSPYDVIIIIGKE